MSALTPPPPPTTAAVEIAAPTSTAAPATPATSAASAASAAATTKSSPQPPTSSSSEATTSASVAHPPPATLTKTQSAAMVPSSKIRLIVLLATGQRKALDFSPHTTVLQVKEAVLEKWPADWSSRPTDTSSLRLLHLGHILDDTAYLGTHPSTDGILGGGGHEGATGAAPAATPAANNNGPLAKAKKSSSRDALSGPLGTPIAAGQGRNLPAGQATVVHLLVKGGFLSEKERLEEEKRQAQKESSTLRKRTNKKGSVSGGGDGADASTATDGIGGSTSRSRRANDAEDSQASGGCRCVIC